MVRASLIIIIKNDDIQLDGNSNLIWFIKEKNKDRKLDIENIIKYLLEYFKIKKKKGKVNVLIIGKKENELKNIIEKYENFINFYFEKDIQQRITNFLNKK